MDKRPSVTHIGFLNYILLIEQGYYPHALNAFIKVGPCESEKKPTNNEICLGVKCIEQVMLFWLHFKK